MTMILPSRTHRVVGAAVVAALYAAGIAAPEAANDEPLPVANFTEVKSATTERNGSLELGVVLTHEFAGHLVYCVDGSAEGGIRLCICFGLRVPGGGRRIRQVYERDQDSH